MQLAFRDSLTLNAARIATISVVHDPFRRVRGKGQPCLERTA